MEWYFGSDDEDLTVPKDDEMFDRLPSPDSWPSWVNIVGNLNSQKKLNVLGVEELLLSEQMLSRHAFRHQSACAHDHSDAQLNDLPKIEEADDIFFDSLFKVDAGESEGSYSSAYAAQTSNRSEAVDFSNHIRDSTNDDSDDRHFSPEKELEAEICMFEERSDLCEDINEYISMDEPVLLELQNLTQQLADTTRICFRDSLYRLAENSSSQTKSSRIGKEGLKNCKPTARVGPSRVKESKTNESDTKAIDRTVATLLFTTMTFCDSTAATTSTSASGLDEETLQREYQANSHVYHQGYFTPSLCIVEGGDAEVPTFDLMNQPLAQLSQHGLLNDSCEA